MPFYIVDDIKKRNPDENPNISMQAAAGEFMKAAIVTKPEGEGVPLHMHPNEEQWTYLIEGKMHYVLGDEERILEPGDFVHIPRNVNHRSRAIDGSAKFFTVKSPTGDGDMQQDYNMVGGEASEKAKKSYNEKAKSQ
ncbi:MAG: cupin domain-containing protein [Rhodospirillaceae bacterium]|jgi:quercetin dioxygenase-like cupin family protein